MPLSQLVEKCGFFRMLAHETRFTFRIYWTSLSSKTNIQQPWTASLTVRCLFVSFPTSSLSNVVIVFCTPRCETTCHNWNKIYTFIFAYFINVPTLHLGIVFLMTPVFTFSFACKPSYFLTKVTVPITKCILEMFKYITLILPSQVWLSFRFFHILWSSTIRVGVVTERWAWLPTDGD
jgi:hypothetical protein